MKILALDTSNRPLSVAALEDDKLLAQTTLNMAKKHSATLMPVVSDILAKAQIKPKELDRIVVAKGPGSYTGLRIGVTAAKTLAYTLNKDLVGVSSLATLAANKIDVADKLLVPIFDARRENVFAGVYRSENGKLVEVLPDQHLSIVKLCEFLKDKNVCLIGEDAKKYRAEFGEALDQDKYSFSDLKDDYPSAYVLGLLGKDKAPEDVLTFTPDYLRLTQAEVQWLEKNPGKDQIDNDDYVEKV